MRVELLNRVALKSRLPKVVPSEYVKEAPYPKVK